MKKRVVLIIAGVAVVALGGGAMMVAIQDSPGTDDYCLTLKLVLESPDPAGSPSERFAKVDTLTANLADQAPARLKADVVTYAKGVHGLVAELSKVGYEFAKLSPEQMGALQTPEMTAAASAVMKSAEVDCHLSTTSPAGASWEPTVSGTETAAESTTPPASDSMGTGTTVPPTEQSPRP